MLSFSTETVYIWTGQGNVAFNGQTYLGLGSLLNISTMESGTDISARGITISLSGLDPNLLGDCMTGFKLGLPASILLGVFDSTGNLIDYAITSFVGRMGQPTVSVSGVTATIAINVETRLVDLNSIPDRRYTMQDQAMDYPGDLGFSLVSQIQEKTLYWGDKTLNSNNI
jgi:hypothetical protein